MMKEKEKLLSNKHYRCGESDIWEVGLSSPAGESEGAGGALYEGDMMCLCGRYMVG